MVLWSRWCSGWCSVTKSCLTLCSPVDCSMPGSSVLHFLLEFAQIQLVMLSNHLILCHLLPLLPSVFPRIRVFSNESALHIRWSKYWSFSFSISPSNEYSGLISLGLIGLISLLFKGHKRESSPAPQFESINSSVLSLQWWLAPSFLKGQNWMTGLASQAPQKHPLPKAVFRRF